MNAALGTGAGDYVFFQFGRPKLVNAFLGGLRLHLGNKLNLVRQDAVELPLGMTQFPMFEYDEEKKTLGAAHHPFTAPRPEGTCLAAFQQCPGGQGARLRPGAQRQ